MFPLLSAVAPVIGAGLGSLITARYNARQAQKQMNFQERMSNTSMQRRRADMEKAGLNPYIGMATGQGASSPAGQTSTMVDLGQSMAYATQKAQKDLIREQVTAKKLENRVSRVKNAPYLALEKTVGQGTNELSSKINKWYNSPTQKFKNGKTWWNRPPQKLGKQFYRRPKK